MARSFEKIRQASGGMPAVLIRQIDALFTVMEVAPPGRTQVLLDQAALLQRLSERTVRAGRPGRHHRPLRGAARPARQPGRRRASRRRVARVRSDNKDFEYHLMNVPWFITDGQRVNEVARGPSCTPTATAARSSRRRGEGAVAVRCPPGRGARPDAGRGPGREAHRSARTASAPAGRSASPRRSRQPAPTRPERRPGQRNGLGEAGCGGARRALPAGQTDWLERRPSAIQQVGTSTAPSSATSRHPRADDDRREPRPNTRSSRAAASAALAGSDPRRAGGHTTSRHRPRHQPPRAVTPGGNPAGGRGARGRRTAPQRPARPTTATAVSHEPGRPVERHRGPRRCDPSAIGGAPQNAPSPGCPRTPGPAWCARRQSPPQTPPPARSRSGWPGPPHRGRRRQPHQTASANRAARDTEGEGGRRRWRRCRCP